MADEFKKTLPDQHFYTRDSQQNIWLTYPYGVKLESDPRAILNSIVEAERYIMEDDSQEKDLDEYLKILESSNGDDKYGMGGAFDTHSVASDAEIKTYFTQPSLADTRVGCNDAINPYWQFNRDDDICPPGLVPAVYAAEKNFSTSADRFAKEISHASGMGRVYAETYDSQQQILWIEAGVPRFTNLLDYYRDACQEVAVADAINSGNVTSFAAKIAMFAVRSAVWTFFLPIMSIIWIPRWMERLTNERITKYYTFRSTMTMYYSTVNSMLQYTAVSMGIHPLTLKHRPSENGIGNGADMEHVYDFSKEMDGSKTETKYVEKMVLVEETDSDGNVTKRYEPQMVKEEVPISMSYDSYFAGVPEVLRYGPDIFRIMNRRSRMIDIKRTQYTTDELYELANKQNEDVFIPDEGDATYDNGGFWNFVRNSTSNWWSALKGSVLGSGNHVGFKIEKGASFQEDFANTTGETGLAEKFNQYSEKYKEENELFGRSTAGRIIAKTVNDITENQGVKQSLAGNIMDEVKRAGVGVLSSAMSFDIGSVLVTGNGFLEIPKVWKNSSMTRSYSFGFKLRSRYGDPVSVFQSIYIPMFMLIAFAAPRAIGSNAYTSPFLIRAYCKGMFNIPLGIVTSLTISRGSSEFGWSSQFYPLEVNISITMEDLSPQLFVSMNDGVFDTFSRNSSMQSYLDTLASLGLRDMVYMWPKMVRKMNTALAVARSTIFNSTYRGTAVGKSTLGKVVAAFVPYHTDRASLK